MNKALEKRELAKNIRNTTHFPMLKDYFVRMIEKYFFFYVIYRKLFFKSLIQVRNNRNRIATYSFFLLLLVLILRGKSYAQTTDSVQAWIRHSEQSIKDDKLEESFIWAKKAFDYAQSTAEPSLLSAAARQLGDVYRLKSTLDKAEEMLNISVRIYEKQGNLERYARSIADLARIKQGQRNFEKAIELYTKALEIYNQKLSPAEEEKHIDLKGFILERMAVILSSHQKLYDQAETYALEAYGIFERIGDKKRLEITSTSLGNIYFWKKNFPKASNYYEKAYEISKSIGYNTGRNLNNLGMIAHNMGNSEKGVTYYLAALEQYKNLGSKELIAQTQINIGDLYNDTGNFPQAIKFTQQGIDGLVAIKTTKGILEGYETLISAYAQSNNYSKAFEVQKRYVALKDSIFYKSQSTELNELQAKFETEKKNKEILLLSNENTVQSKNNDLLRGALFFLILLGLILWQFYTYRQKIQREREHIAQLRAEEAAQRQWQETELRALRSQMNPHFIFNCLNSIKSLTLKNETDKASMYITKFSRLMRQVLENSRSEWVSLHDELDTLTLYLDMEKLRFHNKFCFKLEVSPDLSTHSIKVPPMLIQPYVENAIWHGLMHKDGHGEVVVSLIENDDKQLIIKVIDNGIGRKRSSELKSKSATEKKSFGLKITSERMDILNQYYKINASSTINDLYDELGNPIGTEVCLIIPI